MMNLDCTARTRTRSQSVIAASAAAAMSLTLASMPARADTLVWNNTSTSTSTPAQWDGAALNFNDATTSTANVPYTDGSAVQFNDTLRNGNTIALQVGNVTAGGGVTPSSVEFTHTTGGTTSYNLLSNVSGTVGITGSASLMLDSGFGGTVFLGNANTYSGGTFVNGGTFRAGTASLPATAVITLGGGTFQAPTGSGALYTANQNFVAASGTSSTFALTSGTSTSIAGTVTSTSGATVANTTLNVSIPGTTTMTGVNFANAATATPSSSFAGTVQFGASTGTVRVTTGSPNAVFDLGTATQTLAITNAGTAVYLGGLAGGASTILTGPANGTSANTNYVIGSAGATTTFGGLLTAGGKGRPLLTIVGGALTMTNGGQTFSTGGAGTGNAITINGGALYLNNTTGSASGVSGIAVNGGTLGGTGLTNGAVAALATGIVTVNANAAAGYSTGGHIAPGSAGAAVGSTPGTLTLSSGLTLNDFSNLDFTLNAASTATANDLINTGALVAPASGLVQVNFAFTGGTPVNGSTYDLINYTALTGSPSTWVATGVPAGYTAAFTAPGNGQVDVTFSTTAGTPEPASLALFGSVFGLLLARRRRAAA